MKSKGTWVFLGVVAFVVGLTIWDLQNESKESQKKAQDSSLVPYQGDHVQKILIQRKDEKIELDKSVDGWKLISPLNDWADNSAVQDLIFQLTSQKYIKVIGSGSGVDPKTYGLDQPAGTLQVTLQNGEGVTWEVGSAKSYEGNSYLRKLGGKEIYLARADWSDWIQKKSFEFRDRRIFRVRIGAVNKIDIKTPKTKFTLEKKDNKWTVPGFNIDQNRVQEFLNQLNQTNATEILAEKEVAQKLKDRYIGKTALYEIALSTNDKTLKTGISESKEGIFALTSDPQFLLKLDVTVVPKIKYLKVSDFRNKKEAFDFNKDLVKKIDFETSLKKQSLILNGETWNLAQPDPKLEISNEMANSLVNQLRHLKITEFVKPSMNLKNKITLKDQENKLVFELQWGDSQKLKFDESDKTVVMAQSNLIKDGFYLEQSEIEKLNLNLIIKPKESSQPQEKKAGQK